MATEAEFIANAMRSSRLVDTEITDPEIAAYDREQVRKQELWRKVSRVFDERAYANRASVYSEVEMRQVFGDAYVDQFQDTI